MQTTEIPGAWVTADHLCIVWCKQVVVVVVRSLFDLIDPFTGKWMKNFARRHEVLTYHLKKVLDKFYTIEFFHY